MLRHLRAAFPHAEVTACDLLKDGVDFCASTLGATGVYSDTDPARIDLPRDSFDLIWVGSLFTHFGLKQWKLFLPFFRDLLAHNGVVVFSTQGRHSHRQLFHDVYRYDLDASQRKRLLKQYETSGFGYVDYQGGNDYGISLAEPAWVCRLITSVPDLRLTYVNERAWDAHQDIFACVRDVAWKAVCTRAPDADASEDGPAAQSARAKPDRPLEAVVEAVCVRYGCRVTPTLSPLAGRGRRLATWARRCGETRVSSMRTVAERSAPRRRSGWTEGRVTGVAANDRF